MNRHSITKDRKSDDTICVLHGKRADNQDTWVESFSISDAKKAGIYRNQWLKYPKDMLFARALSRLARQLFPDIIKGCYVQYEISEAVAFDAPVANEEPAMDEILNVKHISADEADHLDAMIGDDEAYRECVMSFIKKHFNIVSLADIPHSLYDKILPIATGKFEERKAKALGLVSGEEQQIAFCNA